MSFDCEYGDHAAAAELLAAAVPVDEDMPIRYEVRRAADRAVIAVTVFTPGHGDLGDLEVWRLQGSRQQQVAGPTGWIPPGTTPATAQEAAEPPAAAGPDTGPSTRELLIQRVYRAFHAHFDRTGGSYSWVGMAAAAVDELAPDATR